MVIVFNKLYKGREVNHSLEQQTKVEASLKLAHGVLHHRKVMENPVNAI